MYNIKKLNSISPVYHGILTNSDYTVSGDVENPDAIIVRSASMHDMPINENLLCVGRAGVESMSRSRLVSEEALDLEAARAAAEDFLQSRGYAGLALTEARQSACLGLFTFAREQDGALCPDCVLRIGIALDDGSVYSFDATAFDPEPLAVNWELDEDAARAALPEGLAVRESRRLILKSPGGRALPVYAFSCRDGRRSVEICVSAETGKQVRISVT